MKKLRFIFIVLLLSKFALGQNNKDSAYIYTFGGIQNDICNQVKPTSDGGYILIGTTNSFGPGNTSFYAIKTDSLCHRKWSNAYGGRINQGGYSVTPTLDKGYAFLGFTDSYGAGGYDVFLVKTDSTGKTQWQKTYGGSDWDFGYSISQTKDSGYVICGLTYSYGAGNGDVFVVRTDKNGDTLWTRAIGGDGYDVGNSIYVQKDSIYVIAGATTSFGAGDTDSYFIKINNKGTIETAKTFGITKNDAVYSIRGTMDKGFLMYGYTDSMPSSNTTFRSEMMIKTDSNGKIQWPLQIYYNGLVGIGRDAVECPDGNVLTVATAKQNGYPFQMHIQETGSGGWWEDGLLFEGTGDEQGFSIAYHNKYNFAFAGTTTYGAGLFDVYMVRFTYDSLQGSYKLYQNFYTDTTLGPAGVSSVSLPQVGVRIFPNPMISTATVLVQGEAAKDYKLSLFDENGKCVKANMPISQVGHGLSQTIIGKDDLCSGTYMYRVTNSENNEVATGKIIIE